MGLSEDDCTVWKFHDFSIMQILREINFKDFWSAKSAIWTHLEALNFHFYECLHFFQNWFHVKTELHKILQFPHCVPKRKSPISSLILHTVCRTYFYKFIKMQKYLRISLNPSTVSGRKICFWIWPKKALQISRLSQVAHICT